MQMPRWFLLAAALLAACGDDPSQPALAAPGAFDAGSDATVVEEADAATAWEAGMDADASTADAFQQTYSCPIELALSLQQATVDDLRALMLEAKPLHVIDVREPSETASGVIEGALLYPWTSGVLEADHASLPVGEPLYVICRSGNRSLPAATYLVEQGHACVFNVKGGMNAWSAAGYETVLPQ